MSPPSPAGRRASSNATLDRSLRAWLLALVTAVVVVLVDQASKAAVRSSIVPGEARSVLPGLQFVNTRNRGIAFGFLPGQHWAITVLIAVALLILLVYFARHSTLALIWLPTGMLVGGALGNVFDRVRAGYVTDFVKLPLGWPPFNLADAAITIGVLLLVLVIERRSAAESQPSAAQQSP
ncbi:MAG TPA: signal peptidase II [Solirubrobacteraceae bacterium]|nr:signal peptidase II [Solirubrobacteraceae bacterium]